MKNSFSLPAITSKLSSCLRKLSRPVKDLLSPYCLLTTAKFENSKGLRKCGCLRTQIS